MTSKNLFHIKTENILFQEICWNQKINDGIIHEKLSK